MRVNSGLINAADYSYDDKVRGENYQDFIMGSVPTKSFSPELRVNFQGQFPDTIKFFVKAKYKFEGQDDIPLDFQSEVRSPFITWQEFKIVFDRLPFEF